MSNLNTILNKLGKIEAIHETNLGKHEIELGTLQDVYNKIDSNAKDSQKAFDMVFKAKGMLTNANTFEKGVVKNYQSIYVELTKLTKTVKDLGLSTAEIDNKLKLVKGYIDKHESNQKNIEKAISML
jgi:hypothetical protein